MDKVWRSVFSSIAYLGDKVPEKNDLYVGEDGIFDGFIVSTRDNVVISHLQFADNTMFFLGKPWIGL